MWQDSKVSLLVARHINNACPTEGFYNRLTGLRGQVANWTQSRVEVQY